MKNLIHIMIPLILFGCVGQTKKEQTGAICGNAIERSSDSLILVGKELFNNNCAACHHPTMKIVGGPFQKIREDYGQGWCLSFIQNSDSMRMIGDIKSLYIYYKFQKLMMPKFTHLTKSQIELILNYVDSFEYVYETGGFSYYSHRKLSLNSMKDSIEYYKENEENY
jgi:hypothetical protein